ncbi:hypothetical protein Ddye_007522 [Dipteronia dyeriana]|uniref:Uncharacterized protein n=1 Tax=Dipteronia dyeriana TaxID=168575 RepID=A0AAD9XK30_9ROSI|nr:hypothetical protein Ddye_007522 [Dipteronia dyeriana]
MNRGSYDRVTKTASTTTDPMMRRHPLRGFWIKTRRLSIPRLRLFRCFYWLRYLCKCKYWKLSYGQAFMKKIKTSVVKTFIFPHHHRRRNKNNDDDHDNQKRRMVLLSGGDSSGGGGRTYNSFYSDAIKDCLEYIKMSAISNEDGKCNIDRG